jgi:hypothetical protein
MRIELVCSNISFGEESSPPFVDGKKLTFNNVTYDFSPLLEGAEIDLGQPFTAPVKCVNGQILVSLTYLYSSETALPEQSTDIADYTFEIESGQCPCPIKRKPAPAESVEVEDEQ